MTKSHFSEDKVEMLFNLFYLKYGLGRTIILKANAVFCQAVFYALYNHNYFSFNFAIA